MLEGLSPIHLLLIMVSAAVWVVPLVLLLAVLARARRPSQPDPRAILAERLVHGEITREDFDTAMHALEGPRTYTRWPGHREGPEGGPPPGDATQHEPPD